MNIPTMHASGSPFLRTVALPHAACRCCGATASLWDVVDFNKNCEEQHKKRVLPCAGVPVYYHRCATCGFIFTTAFDELNSAQFKQHIYNEQYALVDPDFATIRPQKMAADLQTVLGPAARSCSLLDYGCGNGLLGERLRGLGFTDVTDYDPFVEKYSQRPARRFDCIVSIEVFEHSTDPRRTLADIVSFLKEPGLIIFTTLVQPEPDDKVSANWWYIAPRNGHASIFSRRSLRVLAESFGMMVASQHDWLHVMYRQLPPFVSHWQMRK